MAEKLEKMLKKNKYTILLFWVLLVYLIFLGIYAIVFKKVANVTEGIFVIALACFVYTDVVLTVEYKKTKKIIDGINGVKVRYEYIETYVKGQELVIEVQKKEIERLQKDLAELQVEFKKLKEDDKLIQYTVDLK